MGHMLRAATYMDHRASVLKGHGIGVRPRVEGSDVGTVGGNAPRSSPRPICEDVLRAPSAYSWFDDDGTQHEGTQAEGGEQGDPLMPLLDDVYVVCQLERVRPLFDLLSELQGSVSLRARRGCGTSLELCHRMLKSSGLTLAAQASPSSARSSGLRSASRRGSNGGWWTNVCYGRPSQPSQTFNALGRSCCKAQTQGPTTPFALCFATDDVRRVRTSSRRGDLATARRLLSEVSGSQAEQDRAHQVATIPMRMGGLGLRSASRCSPAACWASWADASREGIL